MACLPSVQKSFGELGPSSMPSPATFILRRLVRAVRSLTEVSSGCGGSARLGSECEGALPVEECGNFGEELDVDGSLGEVAEML